MDITSLEYFVNIAFVLLFVTWGLVDILKHRRRIKRSDGGCYTDSLEYELRQRKFTTFTMITVLCNAMVSIIYLGFCLYTYWKLYIIDSRPVFSAMTWVVATLVVVYSMKRNSREDKRWPLVLLLWWVFSSVFVSVSVCVHFITHLKSVAFPYLSLPEANFADTASLPFTLLLCFNALPLNCTKKHHEIEHPLLQKDQEGYSSTNHVDDFENAGLWSKLTFRWLNPLFKVGRVQKLELDHIPSIPDSETADKASTLLEKSLRKQKTQATSLPRAIFSAVWRPLAINAIFAGLNTIASYIGPYLITNFVNFLTGKHDDSSYHYGLILV